VDDANTLNEVAPRARSLSKSELAELSKSELAESAAGWRKGGDSVVSAG
jgi:hypothetical protein